MLKINLLCFSFVVSLLIAPALFAAELPLEVQSCLDTVNQNYAVERTDYRTYIENIRHCYTDNNAADLMPRELTYEIPAENYTIADCQIDAQYWLSFAAGECIEDVQARFAAGELTVEQLSADSIACGQGELLDEFNRRVAACYENTSLSNVWSLPVLRDALNSTYNDYNLNPAEAQPELVACLERADADFDLAIPSSEAERAIAVCFNAAGLSGLSQTYKKTAIVIDCAKDSLGVDNLENFSTLILQTTPEQEAFLEQCVLDKTTPIIAGVAALNIPIAAGGFQTLIFIQFLIFQVAHVFRRKKNVDGGLVFDAFSGQPLDLCILRLQTADSDKLQSTFVTGRHGRYLFLPDPGKYSVTAKRDSYKFPSELPINQTENYRGETIEIKTGSDVVNRNIPLDPDVKIISPLKWNWLKRRDQVSLSIAWLAPIYSVGTLFLVQAWWLILFAILNIVFLIIFYRLRRRASASEFGRVLSADKKPVKNVRVSLFEAGKNKLVSYYITDKFGRYFFPAVKGEYLLQTDKTGFQPVKQTVKVTEENEKNHNIKVELILKHVA